MPKQPRAKEPGTPQTGAPDATGNYVPPADAEGRARLAMQEQEERADNLADLIGDANESETQLPPAARNEKEDRDRAAALAWAALHGAKVLAARVPKLEAMAAGLRTHLDVLADQAGAKVASGIARAAPWILDYAGTVAAIIRGVLAEPVLCAKCRADLAGQEPQP